MQKIGNEARKTNDFEFNITHTCDWATNLKMCHLIDNCLNYIIEKELYKYVKWFMFYTLLKFKHMFI